MGKTGEPRKTSRKLFITKSREIWREVLVRYSREISRKQ